MKDYNEFITAIAKLMCLESKDCLISDITFSINNIDFIIPIIVSFCSPENVEYREMYSYMYRLVGVHEKMNSHVKNAVYQFIQEQIYPISQDNSGTSPQSKAEINRDNNGYQLVENRKVRITNNYYLGKYQDLENSLDKLPITERYEIIAKIFEYIENREKE